MFPNNNDFTSNQTSDVTTDSHDGKKHFKKSKKIRLKCSLCKERYTYDVSYSDLSTLKKFISVRGNMIARTKSGLCAKHQRALRCAIGQARILALLPFVDLGLSNSN